MLRAVPIVSTNIITTKLWKKFDYAFGKIDPIG